MLLQKENIRKVSCMRKREQQLKMLLASACWYSVVFSLSVSKWYDNNFICRVCLWRVFFRAKRNHTSDTTRKQVLKDPKMFSIDWIPFSFVRLYIYYLFIVFDCVLFFSWPKYGIVESLKFNDKREQAEAVEMTERTEILEMIMSMKCLRTLNTMSAEGKARKA